MKRPCGWRCTMETGSERPRLLSGPNAIHRLCRRWQSAERTDWLGSPSARRCCFNQASESRWRSLGSAGEEEAARFFSRGVWAPASAIDRIRAELKVERSTESFAKRKEADAKRREKAQAAYTEDFTGAVVKFLAFHPGHSDLAQRLAGAVADHATPVGSGTVARTKRIPLEQRAEAAVIAWMRHQTTAYDSMKIPRVKGKRREVRRMLAQRSKELLAQYRQGKECGRSARS